MEFDPTFENHHQLAFNGYTVLKGRVPSQLLVDALIELRTEIAVPGALDWRGGGKWFGHVNYSPDVRNQVITHVTRDAQIKRLVDRTLGSDCKVIGLVGNANLPNSRYQPAHVDGNLGDDVVIVNIPVGDVTEQNGSTEIWPRTNKTRLSYAQFIRAHSPSTRLNSANGDIIIRYPNVWHRGTPNRSADARFMLGLVISSGYRNRPPVIISRSDVEIIEEFAIPVHYRIGQQSRRGFRANYFKPNLSGNLKELCWIYTPRLFKFLRYISSI